MPRRRSLLAIALAVVLVAAACGGDDEATDDQDTTTGSTATVDTDATTATTARSSGSVDADDDTGDTDDDQGDDGAAAESEAGGDTVASGTTDRPIPGACDTRTGGTASFTTDAGGPTISVQLVVPPDGSAEPLPAVIDFHGLGSNGVEQSTLTGYAELARREGFIAVHPTGARSSWELAQLDQPNRDDLAMIDDLIEQLVTEHCVDPTRIYSTGMSNGGFFTARLVCERADRIAAAVSVAGVSHPDGCEPSRPVPFRAYHGTDDEVVRFAGGRSSLQTGGSDAATEAFFEQSMPDEFAEFAADFGCEAEPERVEVTDEVVRYDYVGCDEDVPLSFFEVIEGGHTWPGSPIGFLLTAALGRTTDDVSATADGWAFMSRFSLPDVDG